MTSSSFSSRKSSASCPYITSSGMGISGRMSLPKTASLFTRRKSSPKVAELWVWVTPMEMLSKRRSARSDSRFFSRSSRPIGGSHRSNDTNTACVCPLSSARAVAVMGSLTYSDTLWYICPSNTTGRSGVMLAVAQPIWIAFKFVPPSRSSPICTSRLQTGCMNWCLGRHTAQESPR